MSRSIDRVARELLELKRQVRHLSTQPRLAYSSVEGGFITWNDPDGVARSVIGVQDDGTVTTRDLNAPPPVAPAAPAVTNDSPGLLTITSYGLTSDGSNWLRDLYVIEVHASTTSDFTPTPATKVSQFGPDGGVAAVALPDGTWYVVLVAVNTSGASSPPSTQVAEVVIPPVISSGIETYFTDVEPTGDIVDGSIWYDTGNGNAVHYWNGVAWQDARDAGIIAAQAAASEASDIASAAQSSAEGAQATADSKTATYYQDTDPSLDGTLTVGDEWTVPGSDNLRMRWDGTVWQPLLAGPGAVSTDVLAGKKVPVSSEVELEWGVPDPVTPLGAPTFQAESTGLTARSGSGLTADGTDFTFLRKVSQTKYQPIRRNPTTGVETELGGGVNVSWTSQNKIEYCTGIAKLGGYYWTLHLSTDLSTLATTISVRKFAADFSSRLATYTLKTVPQTDPDSTTALNGEWGLGQDGTNLLVGYQASTGKLRIEKYNTTGGLVSTINSTTTGGPSVVSDIAYGNFDFGAARYLVAGESIVSMTTGGVIQAAEGVARSTQGIEWNAATGRIILDAASYQLTTQTAANNRWASYTWADLNAAGTGTHETALSPAVSITIPARLQPRWATIPWSSGASIPGDDAASSIKLYLADRPSGTVPGSTSFHLADTDTYPGTQLVGSTDLTGATPPAVSTFANGDSGSLVSKAGGFVVRGDGTGDWPYYTGQLDLRYDARYVKIASATAWTNVTLQNGATQDAAAPIRYRRDACGNVWVTGHLNSGPDSTTIFTLPVGFRPIQDMKWNSIASGWDLANFSINADGTASINGQAEGSGATLTNAWLSASFPAA